MYSLIDLSTYTRLEWTTDKHLIHEWAERWSRRNPEVHFAVRLTDSERFVAVYRNGQSVKFEQTRVG